MENYTTNEKALKMATEYVKIEKLLKDTCPELEDDEIETVMEFAKKLAIDMNMDLCDVVASLIKSAD